MQNLNVLVPIRETNGAYSVYELDPEELVWPELIDIWNHAKIQKPICFAPPDEKLDLFFLYSCKAANLPLSLGNVFNPSWTEKFMAEIGHDSLVISSALVSYVTDNALFSKQLMQMKKVIVIGASEHDPEMRLRRIGSHLDVQTLHHPTDRFRS